MRPPARIFTRAWTAAFCLGVAANLARGDGGSPQSAESKLEALLGDPAKAEWDSLSHFDGTLTRGEFEQRLEKPFDPSHGLAPYIRITDAGFQALASASAGAPVLAKVRFAAVGERKNSLEVGFRSPGSFRADHEINSLPLAGLKVAIEPADIGGKWAEMEDRSVDFKGFGLINEGDLNLIVAERLRDKLSSLGATVFLVRDKAQPVLSVPTDDAVSAAEDLLANRAGDFPHAFQYKEAPLAPDNPARLRIAAGLLVTKNAETRARAERLRRNFSPDVTIVLQFDATPGSSEGRLATANRNIFFVEGAYTPGELAEPEQRFRLLTKVLARVTPIETEVAAAVAERFQAITGFPPVFYGNSPTTRLVLPGNAYVVARNLAFNREHDGPVVVTEPYLMNEAETLARLVAGDYPGERMVGGRSRRSIFREYADCVAEGMVVAYGPRQ